jgi:hypothetical protein
LVGAQQPVEVEPLNHEVRWRVRWAQVDVRIRIWNVGANRCCLRRDILGTWPAPVDIG